MSRIAVFGAAGMGGRRITAEAVSRGHAVLSVVRKPDATSADPRAELVQGDALDPHDVVRIGKLVDAIVVAVGSRPVNPAYEVAKNMVAALAEMDEPRPRVLHMGGGGSLLTEDRTRILDSPTFPEPFLESARTQAAALDHYREHAAMHGITWTFVSPPPVDFKPGMRTGTYRTSRETPVVDAEGRSAVSYEDFAMAMVDEIENPFFVNTRFTVGY